MAMIATESSLGESFARALAARNRDGLLELLDPQVEFRARTQHVTWQADDALVVVDEIVLGRWFEPSDVIEALEAVASTRIGPRHGVSYRLRIASSGDPCVCEQTAYFDISDGRITRMHLVCSGFQPLAGPR